MDHNRLLRGLFRAHGNASHAVQDGPNPTRTGTGATRTKTLKRTVSTRSYQNGPSLGGGTVIDVGRQSRGLGRAAVASSPPMQRSTASNRRDPPSIGSKVGMADHCSLEPFWPVGETAGTLRLAAEGHDDVTSVYSAASIGARFPGSPRRIFPTIGSESRHA